MREPELAAGAYGVSLDRGSKSSMTYYVNYCKSETITLPSLQNGWLDYIIILRSIKYHGPSWNQFFSLIL
jgi:hypothetical protein